MQRIRAESVNALQTLRAAGKRASRARRARRVRLRRPSHRLGAAPSFAAGASTTFLILQRQLDVANDEGRELQAQTDLNKAVAQLNHVAGTNFASYHIDASALGLQTLDAQTPTTTNLPPRR